MPLLTKHFQNRQIQGWKKCETSLEYGQKLRQKCEFFTNFQNFLKEKDFPPEAHISQE